MSRLTFWLLLSVLCAAPALAANGEGGGGHAVVFNIALCTVAATGVALLMKLLRQPLILGYILAGVLIGPVGLRLITDHRDIVTISEIGLILLLFIIGLEIDLTRMLSAGKLVILPGLLQFPVCAALGYAAFWGLSRAGLALGSGAYAALYCALAVSISSTMIVVKLLYDKKELDTLPGRITVGILVFQDIWAILVLAIQPNLANPQVLGILKTFGMGALLVALALGVSRYVLPHVFHFAAKLPELMLVLSLGWCFLVSLVAAHPAVGLSMEMGALIAGVSLATFPYSLDVIAKVISIRDFFTTLFFVALGMQIPVPQTPVVLTAAVVALVALAVRAPGIFAPLYLMQAGHRTAILPALNLSQISEFSLVIAALGVTAGHIGQETLTLLIWVFALLAVGSTYLVTYSHPLQSALSRGLQRAGLKDLSAAREDREGDEERPVVMLGFYRIANAFLEEICRDHQYLLEKIRVVDLNPEMKRRVEALGVHYVYGDIGHQDTLHHAGLHDAHLVLCTIPDSILQGTTNARLLTVLRGLCPDARVVLTAESPEQAEELYAAGADYVIQPSAEAGQALVRAVEYGVTCSLAPIRQEAVQSLKERSGFLS